MSDQSIEKIILTDDQKTLQREAFEQYEQYKKLNGEDNYQAARKSLESCLKLERFIYTDIDPNVAYSLRLLGELAINQQDYLTAQKFYGEALSIQRKILGMNTPLQQLRSTNLGDRKRPSGRCLRQKVLRRSTRYPAQSLRE